ncbi:hypothetical protein Agub_g4628 [Astrephomene gubernaculifera]|uniref:RRM domain-containing protein n=1 Tax=Astrephomene gubernaculifera TaxID=47775 RepID=A0AAD3DMK9_9CHLO|nr:hypothetical protein Agub_g4628 [Astrephomene gubernaculifera]
MNEPEAEDLASPLTPPAKSIGELRRTYIERARRNNGLRAGRARAPFSAPADKLGAEWGVGVGLHFELLKWLRRMALLLIICAIPFLVVVGRSVFTDEAHMHDHAFGVKMYPATRVASMTFAAIVDDSLDNGTLQYMNVELAGSWKGPMQKSTFLVWISLVDAGAALLFVCCLAALWAHLRRFAEASNRSTLEAADYTVMVRGLPPGVNAAQVGAYFSRFGEVIDVVLVTDRLGSTLRHCGKAARLQQRRAMVLDAALVRRTDEKLDELQRLDEQLADTAEQLRGVAEQRQSVRAAFVTFNSENERRACLGHCPGSWLGSLFQRCRDRFLQRRCFWVLRASAPDDYIFEHLAVPEWQQAARQLAVSLVTLLLVLLCAAAITKLTDLRNQESSTIKWRTGKLISDSLTAMTAYPSSSKSPLPPSSLDTSSLAQYPGLADYCTRQLADTCTAQLQASYEGAVRLEFGLGLQWANTTARLLFERPVRAALQNCAAGSSSGIVAGCGLQACLPCLCLGLSLGDSVGVEGSAERNEVTQTCSAFINQLDIRSWGIRLSIALVVACLNSNIKYLLRALVLYGSHWTHTAREVSYALQCWGAMLVNSVVVLLLTNCDALGRLAREGRHGSWVRYFVQYGSYGDFTSGWYENVGLSIMILMLINCASPLLNLAVEGGLLAALRLRVRYILAWPLQADYDAAWARPRFTLEQRTADLLLNASLALLFGSGMPLCFLLLVVYLAVAEAADRWALTGLCGGAPRYNTGLMKLVMALLPWLAVAHCAFGLWMHTHFSVVTTDDVSQLGAAAVRATSARLSSASADLSALQSSELWRRITQPNGLALLLLVVALPLWLILGRYFLWRLLSCMRRTCGLLCVRRTHRIMRQQLSRDLRTELPAVPYTEALVGKLLYGTPTYRLPYHPHYLQYFAASGLNRAVGVAALVAAAASGGAGRPTYTRLRTIHRRHCRFPSGPCDFYVLPEPSTQPAGLPGSSLGGGREPPLAEGVPEADVEHSAPSVVTLAPPPPTRDALIAVQKAAEVEAGGISVTKLLMKMLGASERGGGGVPDAVELLQREEQEAAQQQRGVVAAEVALSMGGVAAAEEAHSVVVLEPFTTAVPAPAAAAAAAGHGVVLVSAAARPAGRREAAGAAAGAAVAGSGTPAEQPGGEFGGGSGVGAAAAASGEPAAAMLVMGEATVACVVRASPLRRQQAPPPPSPQQQQYAERLQAQARGRVEEGSSGAEEAELPPTGGEAGEQQLMLAAAAAAAAAAAMEVGQAPHVALTVQEVGAEEERSGAPSVAQGGQSGLSGGGEHSQV